jgi:hypothetical protein
MRPIDQSTPTCSRRRPVTMGFGRGLQLMLAVGSAVCLAAAPDAVRADVITTYDLSGVTFEDGTTATGSFQTDTGGAVSPGTLLNISIVTEMGPDFPAVTFTGSKSATFVEIGQIGQIDIEDEINNTTYDLQFFFSRPLSQTAMNPLTPGDSREQYDVNGSPIFRFVETGALVPVPVPAPVAGAGIPGLLAGVLAFLFWQSRTAAKALVRRRQRSCQPVAS